MAKQDFPPDIDRRRLLVSAVALAGSSISSICRRSEILNYVGQRSTSSSNAFGYLIAKQALK